jgi:orotate phosphoribosyltransferase
MLLLINLMCYKIMFKYCQCVAQSKSVPSSGHSIELYCEMRKYIMWKKCVKLIVMSFMREVTVCEYLMSYDVSRLQSRQTV